MCHRHLQDEGFPHDRVVHSNFSQKGKYWCNASSAEECTLVVGTCLHVMHDGSTMSRIAFAELQAQYWQSTFTDLHRFATAYAQ